MQLHPGWVGVLQRRYLNALGCLWFNRTQARRGLLLFSVPGSHSAGLLLPGEVPPVLSARAAGQHA